MGYSLQDISACTDVNVEIYMSGRVPVVTPKQQQRTSIFTKPSAGIFNTRYSDFVDEVNDLPDHVLPS
jgi:hypothetical protein